jgi:hypothetical protein
MGVNGRIGLLFLTWLVVVVVASLLIGSERKRQWFYMRDTSKSFFNRRGVLGELMQFGFPRTREGWMVFVGFLAMILVSGYIVVG